MQRAKQRNEKQNHIDSDFGEDWDEYNIVEKGGGLSKTIDVVGPGEGDPSSYSTADMICKSIDAQAPREDVPPLSTKMEKLCDMIESDLRTDPTVKIVVFTSFLSEMDILFREMGRRMIGSTRIHGGLNPMHRSHHIQAFENPESCINVMLAQIMCMSTGVNLQCASIAYITSPSWNPCIEEQAIGRLHRQGQTRRVFVRRLIMRDSVETRCLAIQKRKLDIIRTNVEASSSDRQKDKNMKDIAKEAIRALATRKTQEDGERLRQAIQTASENERACEKELEAATHLTVQDMQHLLTTSMTTTTTTTP